MKRSLLSLLVALAALAACKDKPPGQLEPIARPADFQEPPKPAAPKPAPAPPVDPNKVVLRWKLAPRAPVAYRLEGTPSGADASGLKTDYVLQRSDSGDLTVRIIQQSSKPTEDRGTFSERGFILDGLGEVDRNVATLLLELPKEPVAVGDTWGLGADLVDKAPLGRGFFEKKSERHNTVKLTALVPEGDERIATIEYDVLERISGTFSHGGPNSREAGETAALKAATAAASKGKGKGKKEEPPEPKAKSPDDQAASSEVTFTGHGEFLVKAGRWRSWEGTLSSKTEGFTPSPDKSANLVPPGTLKLRLTALDAIPPELQPEAKK